jgi:hypothetical protein
MGVNPTTEAVLLRDGSLGVSTENTPRAVQDNGTNSRKVTVNRDWLEQLEIAEPGSQTVHSLSMAIKPVIVQHPAIIVQPASVIGGDSDA